MTDARTVFITGAASGIGLQLARRFQAAGWHVAASDLSKQALDKAFPESGEALLLLTLDVRDAIAFGDAIQQTVAAWGSLDVLINNAGIIRPARIIDSTAEEAHNHIDVNLKGVIFGTQAAARCMRDQSQGGHIINIASMAGVAPVTGIGLYTASKFGVRAFSLVAAEELQEAGIAVTVICPDLVDTPMLDLQLDHPEAAITFSGPGALATDRIADAVFTALRCKPLEMLLPRHRGWLAKLASAFPGLVSPLRKQMERRGAHAAARYRDARRM